MTSFLNQPSDSSFSIQAMNKNYTKSNNQSLTNETDQFDLIKNKKNFTVAVRIKPEFNASPSTLINTSVKKISQQNEELKLSFEGNKYQFNSYGQTNEKKLVFDKIYESEAQNQQIFVSLVEKKLPLLEKGVNLSIMAYGATNSGKTFTIFGKKQDEALNKPSIYGLSYLTFKKVFEMFQADYNVAFSFIQIYNENVYDLLNPQGITNPLNVMQNSQGSTNVIGLNKIQITSSAQLQTLITSGNQARISSSNLQNIHSSRSHAFMQLQIRHKSTKQRTKMVIVDLAGSEKYLYTASSTSSTGGNLLLKQGSNINKSLLSLGNCIKSLHENDQHIPYRDSKLTRLLKQNLSGYAHNIMIACINKKMSNFEENMNSLNYALKAIKIQKEIVRKIQSQELSQYQCTNCRQKLPYSLVKDINKHQEHMRRVKTRQSHSLSISPISKSGINSNELLPFKSSQFMGSGTKIGYKKFQKIVDETFDNIMRKILDLSSFDKNEIEGIFDSEKRIIKNQMKEQIFLSKSKNKSKNQQFSSESLMGQGVNVSEFDSPSQFPSFLQNQNNHNGLTPQCPAQKKEKKLKISLSKPNKKPQKVLERTASTITNTPLIVNSHRNHQSSQDSPTESHKINQSSNYIKIQDQQTSNSDQSGFSGHNSFRSNLTVEILNDKDKILNERRKVLEETLNDNKNRRKGSNDVNGNILKFKSTQNSLKTKNISNFILLSEDLSGQSSSQANKNANKIRFTQKCNKQNFMKIEDGFAQNKSKKQCPQVCIPEEQLQSTLQEITSFDDFIINQRLLDSTSIAPRMKRDDEEELQAWKNIVIKNVDSPMSSSIFSSFNKKNFNENDDLCRHSFLNHTNKNHQVHQESFVEERIHANDNINANSQRNIFKFCRY